MTEVVAVGAETTQPGVNIGIDVLGEIQKRVLWFSTAVIDHANRVRESVGSEGGWPSGVVRGDGVDHDVVVV